jgi:hypothetical protein
VNCKFQCQTGLKNSNQLDSKDQKVALPDLEPTIEDALSSLAAARRYVLSFGWN